jgi:hypothetical protein
LLPALGLFEEPLDLWQKIQGNLVPTMMKAGAAQAGDTGAALSGDTGAALG